MATSDRTRELAVKFVKPFCTESDDHDYPQHNCRKCMEMAERLMALLDAFERQVRGEEANTCVDILAAHLKAMDIQSRIAELAAQPTPEVKK